MRRSFLFTLLIILAGLVHAQKSDYNWLSGYQSWAHSTYDSITYGYNFGNVKLDFNDSAVNVINDSIGMNFDKTNTTYSDSNGNILFYSNGIYVATLWMKCSRMATVLM